MLSPYSRFAFLALLTGFAAIGPVTGAHAQSSPVPQDTLPALKEFAAGGAGPLTMTVATAPGPVSVGGYDVMNLETLRVCQGSTCDDDTLYAGAVLSVEPGGNLSFDLVNSLTNPDPNTTTGPCMLHGEQRWDPLVGWSAPDNPVNLHTHGLLVPPDKKGNGGGGLQYGDNVFACATVGQTLRYSIDIPPAETGRSVPAGANWFHPHVHGLAKAQVSSGMAGMIVVAASADSPDAARVYRNIMLKDMQVVQPTADGPWFNYADQDPGFCGAYGGSANFLSEANIGQCVIAPDVAQALGPNGHAAHDGRWLFTMNGALYPTIVVEPAKKQFWRVQNASANVTYRLSLRQANQLPGTAPKVAMFEILSMDGAGLLGVAGRRTDAPKAKEVLLMPGSRVQIAVSNPAPAATADFELVNAPFEAGFTKEIADTWPRVTLALVRFQGVPRPSPMAAEQIVAASLPQGDAGMVMRSLIATPPQHYAPGVVEGCREQAMISNGQLKSGTRRRIYFGIGTGDDQKEYFALGETILTRDAQGNEVELAPDGTPVAGSVALESFDPAKFTCILRAEGEAEKETWQLVNVSAEVHNFHIHQMKFWPDRNQAGQVIRRTPALFDNVNLPASLLPTVQAGEMFHDTIIVPRGTTACDGALDFVQMTGGADMPTAHFVLNRASHPDCSGDGGQTDQSGMLQIKMLFNGPQFAGFEDPDDSTRILPADFVYHCHILEHEDHGMMSGVRVLESRYFPQSIAATH